VVEDHHGPFAASAIDYAAGMGAVLRLKTDIGLTRAFWQTKSVGSPPRECRDSGRRLARRAAKAVEDRMTANELGHSLLLNLSIHIYELDFGYEKFVVKQPSS
jgi:hypothetical protein